MSCHSRCSASSFVSRAGAAAHARPHAVAMLALGALMLGGCTSLPWSQDVTKAKAPLKVPVPAQDPVVSPVAIPAAKPSRPSAEQRGLARAIHLPSTFLPPPQAQEYQVWRCTPAQDLLMAFGHSDETAAVASAEDGEDHRPGDDWLRLWSRQHAYALGRVVSASGARYHASAAPEEVARLQRSEQGADELEVWFKGTQATLHNARGTLDCLMDDQRAISLSRGGPLLMAQGNEPGWQVSLDREHNQLSLTLSPGLVDNLAADEASEDKLAHAASDTSSRTLTLPYHLKKVRKTQEGDDSKRVLTASLPDSLGAGRTLAFSVAPGACFDSMQGTPYPLTVQLKLGERVLSGCGEAFR